MICVTSRKTEMKEDTPTYTQVVHRRESEDEKKLKEVRWKCSYGNRENGTLTKKWKRGNSPMNFLVEECR